MNDMKKKYTEPEITVIDFDVTDVIATSGGGDNPTPPMPELLKGVWTVFEDSIFG